MVQAGEPAATAARIVDVTPRRTSARGIGPALALASVVVACGASAPSASDAPASATTRPARSDDPVGSDVHPPACVDAKLVWAEALGRLLLANCIDQADLTSRETLWAWDGETWELLSDDGPPAHVVTGVGWDPARGVLVRYGGIPLPEQDCSPETWEWGAAGGWQQVETEPPDPCDHIELAWDAPGSRMLLVGGGRGQDLMSGTWAWDGSKWSPVMSEGPAPRAHQGIASLAGAGIVLHGGIDLDQVFDDTWSWDGQRWTEIADQSRDSPGPRSHQGFAAGSEGAILVGGATTTSTFDSLTDDTRLLASDTWTPVRSEGSHPSARGLPALGYDPDRDLFVLYGGFSADGAPLADTWEWDGADWRCAGGC